jgi:hypothetical protein
MSSLFKEERPRMRSESLLPLVRAAMSRGEGPPVVLEWIRAHGHTGESETWTSTHEARARALAGRLADSFTRSRSDTRIYHPGETLVAESGLTR